MKAGNNSVTSKWGVVLITVILTKHLWSSLILELRLEFWEEKQGYHRKWTLLQRVCRRLDLLPIASLFYNTIILFTNAWAIAHSIQTIMYRCMYTTTPKSHNTFNSFPIKGRQEINILSVLRIVSINLFLSCFLPFLFFFLTSVFFSFVLLSYVQLLVFGVFISLLPLKPLLNSLLALFYSYLYNLN